MDEKVEQVKGTSLWRDAWKRLLKNRLAVFGLIMLGIMAVLVILGPMVLYWATGITADEIPANGDLIKSFPPSMHHLMGTDEAGRDLFARVMQGGRISLDGRYHIDHRIACGRRIVRSDRRISRRPHR